LTTGNSGDGGGLYNFSDNGDALVTITNSSISFNIVYAGDETGGDNGLGGDGGGINNQGVDGNTASIVAIGLSLGGNQAVNGDGGGIYQNTGGDSADDGSVAQVTLQGSPAQRLKTYLIDNKAYEGGGIYNDNTHANQLSTVSLQSGASVVHNQASKTGGGILNEGNPASILIAPGVVIMLNSPNNIVNQ
jgi:hypothetical protein